MTMKEMIARQQAIVSAARSEGRGLTREENEEFTTLQGKIDTARQAPPATGAPAVGDKGSGGDDDAQRGITLERQRVNDIVALCRQTGMDPQEYIRKGESMDNVRTAAVDFMVKNGSPVGSRMNGDEGDNFRSAAVDAMLMRAGVPVKQTNESAEQLRGMTMRDLAIECMSREGIGSTASLLRMSKDELYAQACRQFFNPTSAFPAILDTAIKKSIVHQYQAVPTTFDLWTSKGSVSDFKPTKDHSYLVGGAGDFLRVGENGELKSDKPSTDLLPQRKIDTYGRQFSMTRQAFINDDIGFITEIPGLYAARAKRTINKQVYEILVENPAIFDGANLFAAAHNNLISTGCAPSNEAIQKLMMKLLKQTDQFGEAIMVQPAHIIVPVGYKFLMTTIIASPTINTAGNTQAVNPLYQYKDQLTVVEEGVINALAGSGNVPWFMTGDKSYAKSIQVDYLNGQETPTIRRSEVPGVLGFVWDIFLDWGISALDFRGIARNNGTTISD